MLTMLNLGREQDMTVRFLSVAAVAVVSTAVAVYGYSVLQLAF